ncbi:hypothetical protein CBR_g49866 [Chara braunii]|uniref:Uncharacterized protein n=1 Tax=Chara braunii TaxID=69332 RepID=A0A388JPG7_CHABU|nr:hypothetical protein CBR_g49866 [Chara braunii]|eukprot:GBG59602.1 hypothetical protein CBR_g49866 [Chara braunii]
MPLQLCGGCESSGAVPEGGDLGSGAATHLQRSESRGQYDDKEDEASQPTTTSPLRQRDRSVLSIPGVRQAPLVREELAAPAQKAAVHSEVGLENGEGHGVEDETVGGEGMQGAPQKRRGDRQDDIVGASKKQKTKAPKSVGEKRKGTGGEQDRPGRLLGHDGAKWIVRKKVRNVKPGVAYIDNDKLARKEPPNKKGKNEKEEGDWFVQVPELGTYCWKAMKALTDNEKCRVLKKVLACEVVWVQADSPSLAKLGKLSVQEMVQLVKCDLVQVRLWNYNQFKHEKRSNADWIQKYSFLKTKSAIFKQFESRGLDGDLWDGSRKFVSDATLFKDCLPYMGCDEDHSIEATKSLVGDRKLTVDWRNKVLFVLTRSRLKSREIVLAEGIVHIKWKDTGDVTSIAPFGNDPLEADIRSAELTETGAAAVVRLPQRVTHTDVSEIPFTPCDWSQTTPKRQSSVYGDMERNPTQFVGLLDFVSKKGEGVVFLGKPHVRSVWELLKAGRHVVAMERNSELLQFMMELVKSEVNSGAHNCEFMVVKATRDLVWSNKTDMWFKLSERKRNKIYDFLFLQTRPRKDTGVEYIHLKDHMFALLDNYHGASRMNVKNFLEKLQSLYFVESEEDLKFGSYASLISTNDEVATGVEFDTNVKEEESDTESLDLQCDPSPAEHARGSSSAGPSTSPTSLMSSMAKPEPGTTPMKLLGRLKALAVPSQDPTIGSVVVRDENVSPEGDRRPLGLGREGTSGGPDDTETTKSAEIRTSSGGGGQPVIVVPSATSGGAAVVETEGQSSGFDTGSGEGAELHGRERGGEMEEGKEGEEGEEGEKGEDTELIELLEGKNGTKVNVGIRDDEGQDSEDDAGS